MPDITMCQGKGCPIKNHCYRHIAKPSEFRQAYFEDIPFDGEKCEFFWGDNATQVYDKLKEILKVKNETNSN